MIQISKLTKDDVGKYVEYIGRGRDVTEVGRIKSWNDSHIFVVYAVSDDWEDYQNYTAAATRPEDLEFFDEPSKD